MATKKTVSICCFLVLVLAAMPAMGAEPAADPSFREYIDIVFENNDLEMAALILINEKNLPVNDVIGKARDMGFGFTRIIDALIDTNLTCEEVMIAALLNNAPPAALFDSKKISDDYDYTPELILEFVVKELRFMIRDEEERGEEDYNLDTRNTNIEVILRVCKSMMDDKNFSPFEVMSILCRAEAGNPLIAAAAERFDVPPAVTFKACPRHAEYGHAYISKELPHSAYYVIGVDHMTIDDDAGKRAGIISPMTP
ncbi:MAG: hypothetical protein C4548_16230 [Desulfobacteraceae bacterium]|jgi:hypothetical protein|nr:MAG: hypothetical protein C4548_16230 [Desulfobacteraceae bacterium]